MSDLPFSLNAYLDQDVASQQWLDGIPETFKSQGKACIRYALMFNSSDLRPIQDVLTPILRYESQMVLAAMRDSKTLLSYLRAKLDTIRRTGSIVRIELATFDNRPVARAYQYEQDNDPAKQNPVCLIFFKANVDSRISEIDLCFVPNPIEAVGSGIYPMLP